MNSLREENRLLRAHIKRLEARRDMVVERWPILAAAMEEPAQAQAMREKQKLRPTTRLVRARGE